MKSYTPPRTLALFMHTFMQQRVSLILGPLGSSKTSGMLMTLQVLSQLQRPNTKGVRKTRFCIVRNTVPELRDSVIKTAQNWFDFGSPAIDWRMTTKDLTFRYRLADGTSVESEWQFRALDDERDAAKLLSVDQTAFHLSEFREIPADLLTPIRSRAGRYPTSDDGGPTWHGVIGESNFPVRDSPWYNLIEVERPSWLRVYKQPSGVSPDAENVENLVKGYYEELMKGSTKAWQQAHVLCEYPDTDDGRAVFAESFVREKHVANIHIEPMISDSASPLVIGIDQGRHPAAVVCQMAPDNTLRVLATTYGDGIGMHQFVDEKLLPLLRAEFFGARAICVADPAAAHRTEVDDVSPLDVLRSAGLHAITAPTNQLQRRLEAVEVQLNGPHPLQIDPSCSDLIAALAFKYRFSNTRVGERSLPDKTHPASDLADALQYVCLSVGGVRYGRSLRAIERDRQPAVRQATFNAEAWT